MTLSPSAIGKRLTMARPLAVREASAGISWHFRLKYLAHIGKEKEVIMGIGHYQEFDGIGFTDTHALDALAAAVLGTVGDSGNSLDEAAAAESNHHSLMRDFFNRKVHDGLFADLGAAGITVLGLKLADFFFDQEEDFLSC